MNSTQTDYTPLYLQFGSYSIAVVGVIILSISESLFTGRRFRIVVPIDFLKDDRFSLPYAVAFGSLALSVLNLILTSETLTENITPDVKVWIQLPLWLVEAVINSCPFYPIFASIRHKRPVVGPLVGLLSTGYLISFYIYVIVTSSKGVTTYFETAIVFQQLPVLVCLLVLFLYFFYKGVTDLYHVHTNASNGTLNNCEDIYSSTLIHGKERQYVRMLLRQAPRNQEGSRESDTASWIVKLKEYLLLNNLLRTSPRIIATFVVCAVVIFEIVAEIGFVYHFYSKSIFTSVRNSNFSIVDIKQINTLEEVLGVSVFLSTSIATLTIVAYLFIIYRTYKQHLQMMYKGDFSFLPQKMKETLNKDYVIASLKYSGVQIAYMLWCFILLILVLLVVCLSLAYLLVLPIIGEVPSSFLVPVKYFGPLFIAKYLFNMLESWYINRRFVQHVTPTCKTNLDDKCSSCLALKNRDSLNRVSFFLFFFHAVIGFVSCISRIFIGAAIGALTLARLDGPRLPRGFEHWDNGFSTYVGLIMVELYHRNPILLVFCDELIKTREPFRSEKKDISLQLPSENLGYQRSVSNDVNKRRASLNRNRWYKAYTLVNNPSIRPMTKNTYDRSLKQSENEPTVNCVYIG